MNHVIPSSRSVKAVFGVSVLLLVQNVEGLAKAATGTITGLYERDLARRSARLDRRQSVPSPISLPPQFRLGITPQSDYVQCVYNADTPTYSQLADSYLGAVGPTSNLFCNYDVNDAPSLDCTYDSFTGDLVDFSGSGCPVLYNQAPDVACYTTCVGPYIAAVQIRSSYPQTICYSQAPGSQSSYDTCQYDAYSGDFVSGSAGADCRDVFVEESLDENGQPNGYSCSAYGGCGRAKC